jgi:hypothetical protein
MTAPRCEHELAAARAARTGFASEQTRRHAASCAACEEAAMVASFMNQSVRAMAAAAVPPPPAAAIYWKARLAARQAALRRAERPIQLAERVGYASAALVGLGAAVWAWPLLHGLVARSAGFGTLSTAILTPGLPLLLGASLLPFLLALPVLHALRSKA